MPTLFVKGDLFDDAKDAPGTHAYAFAADCSGGMDRGIAVAFQKRWPALAEAYRARCEGGKMQLGDVFAWQAPGGGEVVYALGLQHGEKKPRVSTLTRALDAMIARATADGVTRIALPRVGAGKGGIDATRVKRVLGEVGERSAVTLAVYEQFIRASQPAS